MANKRNTRKQTLPGSIAVGTVIGFVSCLILCGISASLMLNGSVKEGSGLIAAFISLFLSSMIGSTVAGKAAKEQVAVVCGITAAAYTVMLLGMSVLFFEADFAGIIGKLMSIFLGCIAACILCVRKGKRKGPR